MGKHINSLILIYNSFGDPLFQNLMFSYIKTLSSKIDGKFYLVTFEQNQYKINSSKRKRIKNELRESRILWYPLPFHTGRFLLLKKVIDFTQAFFLMTYLRLRFNTKVIIAFANIAGVIGVVLKKFLGMKMIIYSYEPHSEFMADLGHWNRKSLKFRLLNSLENYTGREADYLMTGTKHMVEHLRSIGVKGKLYRAPTAVDENEFKFKKDGRYRIRKLHEIGEQYLFLYIGKFGGLYYFNEIPRFCSNILNKIPEAFFLIITSNSNDEIADVFKQEIPESKFHITGNLSFDDVKDYLSAADFGISGVPPSKNQKYRSPTKVAEYLLCGLPYITTIGVAEDDEYALKYDVGIVVNSFTEPISEENKDKLLKLLLEDKNTIRSRCRSVGLSYRSKNAVDNNFEEIYRSIIQS